jgi:hypothetical protein
VNNHDPSERDLEAFIDQELKRLPSLKAPPALIDGVLRNLKKRASQRWWRQPLWQWPPAARILALSLFSSLGLFWIAVALLGLQPAWDWASSGIASTLTSWIQPLTPSTLGSWSALLEQGTLWVAAWAGSPWLWALAGFAAGLYLLMIAAGSALFRLFMPASH